MTLNMGPMDRLIRLLLAVLVAILLLAGVLKGTLAIVLGIAALVFLVTSVIGFCPLYVPLKLSTRKKTGD